MATQLARRATPVKSRSPDQLGRFVVTSDQKMVSPTVFVHTRATSCADADQVERKFAELEVRANTDLGAEQGDPH